MKKDTKVVLSAKWWKENRAATLDGAALYAALTIFERATSTFWSAATRFDSAESRSLAQVEGDFIKISGLFAAAVTAVEDVKLAAEKTAKDCRTLIHAETKFVLQNPLKASLKAEKDRLLVALNGCRRGRSARKLEALRQEVQEFADSVAEANREGAGSRPSKTPYEWTDRGRRSFALALERFLNSHEVEKVRGRKIFSTYTAWKVAESAYLVTADRKTAEEIVSVCDERNAKFLPKSMEPAIVAFRLLEPKAPVEVVRPTRATRTARAAAAAPVQPRRVYTAADFVEKNKIVLDSLGDGKTVAFVMAGPVLCIGDRHSIDAYAWVTDQQDWFNGTIKITKGASRLNLGGTGMLEVVGVSSNDDKRNFRAAIKLFSKKSITF